MTKNEPGFIFCEKHEESFHIILQNCKSLPFFCFLAFKKADCTTFALSVGWSVGRLASSLTTIIIQVDQPLGNDHPAELQKRADRANQLVLFFLAGANFWEEHAKNCAIMSMAHITFTIAH